jgi:methionyl-tRNA formyltransferase
METVTLYVMSFKGFAVLEHIIKSNKKHLIDFVIYATDKNVENDYSKDIIKLCQANDLKFLKRGEKLYESKSKFIIAISWRWMIEILYPQKLIVLHDSLLPKYRGFAPLVNALINGENEIGVTALWGNKEYDKGDIIEKSKLKIQYPLKIESAIFSITKCYIDLISNIFDNLLTNNFNSIPQNEEDATYSLWRDENDYFINWNDDSNKIKRFIDAVGYPYNGAKTKIKGKNVIIIEATIIDDVKIENRSNEVGKIIFFKDNLPVVICKNGLIRIDKAVYENTQISIFPLKIFRIKFEN